MLYEQLANKIECINTNHPIQILIQFFECDEWSRNCHVPLQLEVPGACANRHTEHAFDFFPPACSAIFCLVPDAAIARRQVKLYQLRSPCPSHTFEFELMIDACVSFGLWLIADPQPDRVGWGGGIFLVDVPYWYRKSSKVLYVLRSHLARAQPLQSL
jgi:hypothetical protein